MNKKVKAAKLSIISNSSLTVLKLVTGVFMGSISVISEAIHSGIDLVASIIDYLSVRESSKPADVGHPYGHGKFENVGGIIEAVLIIIVAVVVIFNALPRLFHPVEIHSLDIGLAVMVVSIIVNTVVSRRLMAVAKETRSPALEGDAWHLRADIYTSMGILVGLVAIKLTGQMILDPLIAMGVSIFILKVAFDLLKKSFRVIVDEGLSEKEINAINKVMEGKSSEMFLDYHKLRTRMAGSQRFIDLHLVFPRYLPIEAIYDTCRELEKNIYERLNEVDVVIKVEPCQGECYFCRFRYKCGQKLESGDPR